MKINTKTHIILATIKARWRMQFLVVNVPDMNPSVSLLSQFDHTNCWMGQPFDWVTSRKCTVRCVFYDHTAWYCHSVTCSPGLVWSG